MVKKVGLPPGSIIYNGEIYTTNNNIEAHSFSPTIYKYLVDNNAENIINKFSKTSSYTWINLVGLHNTKIIEALGLNYNIHPLVIEDILNTEHRPKTQETSNYIFFTLKMFRVLNGVVDYEQISLILGKDYLLSFQEKEGDLFDYIREKLKDDTSKVRQKGIDYLFYRIIDTVVDSYYVMLENIGDRIELLEEEMHENTVSEHYKKAQELRRELIHFRRVAFPLREALLKLTKESSELISDEEKNYLNDVYDHSIHIIETIELYRDLTAGVIDLYMSSTSNKMNEIMKVLTIISTIFIPITFIAGVYGMNFKFMPELNYKLGYPIALTIMVLIVIVMLIYFKRKKWF